LRQELGPIILQALADPTVTDVWRNPDGNVWASNLGIGHHRIDTMIDFVATNLIGTVSGFHNMTVSNLAPFLEAELPLDGSRFSASIPPISEGPIFAIRKHATLSRNLDDYVKLGSMTPAQCVGIRKRIAAKDNILVAGGQGSGKTTLAGAMLREMVETSDPKFERFGILQDTLELQVPTGINAYSMRTNIAAGVTMEELVRRSMRFTATRFIIGEVRGAEAQHFLEALSTGHPGGMATIHAGSSRQALRRLEQLIRKSGTPVDREEISSLINLIIVVGKMPRGGRMVREVTRVVDGSGGDRLGAGGGGGDYRLEPLL